MLMNTYLTFSGQCEEAFKFYAKVLDGKIEMLLKCGDAPIADQIPVERHQQVMHAHMVIGGYVLMGGDAPTEMYSKPSGFSVTLSYDEIDVAERAFKALSAGGTVHMALQTTFWAQRFGMLVDKFGIPWIINGGPIHLQQ